MRVNTVRERLRAGHPAFGLWTTFGSPHVVEQASQLGFDWILIDTQHGYASYEQAMQSFQILANTDTVPLARVSWNEPALIGKLLDAGALGLVVPMINTREDVEKMVSAMRYPPEGARSAGGDRLPLYGSDYFTEGGNREVLTIPMIETKQAVENVDAILSVPGIDCAFIGPGDLAISLGCFGKFPNDDHEAALQHVLAAGKKHQVPIGLYCMSADDTKRRIAEGFQFVCYSNDTRMFVNAAKEMVTAVKGES